MQGNWQVQREAYLHGWVRQLGLVRFAAWSTACEPAALVGFPNVRNAAAAAVAAARECTLDGDTSSLFYAASALLKLQQMYGLIPRLQVGNMLWAV
jgi:hypothetical protein